ncbi:hypothetical protein CQW49_11135 [Methylosinus trichosporium OB3b]|uniref:Uncharacterized protein n=1 Tax=Methylosinus trichosporium (strain ATCC 35070 / NCIMB 11131 / UNIQEM 75 / OB3b) TaxID=595536 RepID=A0A2D2D083_METT3|nr:hypothetical protein CQW49_11135 [Methylosinus trichosporium OB3b]
MQGKAAPATLLLDQRGEGSEVAWRAVAEPGAAPPSDLDPSAAPWAGGRIGRPWPPRNDRRQRAASDSTTGRKSAFGGRLLMMIAGSIERE